MFAVSAFDDLLDLELNSNVLIFADKQVYILPNGCGIARFVGGNDVDEFLVGFECIEGKQQVYLLLPSQFFFNLIALLLDHVKIKILNKLLLHHQLMILQRWQHIKPLQFLNQLRNQVAILRRIPYFLANSLDNRRDSIILVPERLSEITRQRGDRVSLLNGVLQFLMRNWCFVVDFLDNFNKIISLCLLP